MASLAVKPELASQKEFMVFRVGSEEFSVDVTQVREARIFTSAARIPHAPDYIRGVINLRGTILPIVDLRARLRLASLEREEKSVVVVVVVHDKLLGILVDEVCDIVAAPEEAIKAAPSVEDEAIPELVKALITIGDRVIGLVALE